MERSTESASGYASRSRGQSLGRAFQIGMFDCEFSAHDSFKNCAYGSTSSNRVVARDSESTPNGGRPGDASDEGGAKASSRTEYSHLLVNRPDERICTPERPSGKEIKSPSSRHELRVRQENRTKATKVALSKEQIAVAVKKGFEAGKAAAENGKSGVKQLNLAKDLAKAPGAAKLAALGPGACGAVSLIAAGLKTVESSQHFQAAVTGQTLDGDMQQSIDIADGLAQLCRGEFRSGASSIIKAVTNNSSVEAGVDAADAFIREIENGVRNSNGQIRQPSLKDITDAVSARGKAFEKIEKSFRTPTSNTPTTSDRSNLP